MSETVIRRGPQLGQARTNRNRLRAPVRLLPEQQLAWKAEALRRLGWASRTAAQKGQYAAMQGTADLLMNSELRGGGEHGSEQLRPLRSGSGDDFKTYLDLQAGFETAPERTLDMAAALRAAAQAYIDHYGEHSRSRQQDPKNLRKKAACEATIDSLRRFELGMSLDELGPPPWDSTTAQRAAGLKTVMDLETLPPDQRRASELGGSHESPAFWISKTLENGEVDKSYIFKPAAQTDQPGFPHGGEPAREAIAGRLAGILDGALGMKLRVPETQVVSLSIGSLPQEAIQQHIENGKLLPSEEYVGSVQQFARTDGAMRGLSQQQIDTIPVAASQQLAIFDTISLNVDRHSGNFLVQNDMNGAPQLVPIDQGLTFPTYGAMKSIADNIGTRHNALLRTPGAHQPFSQEAQLALAELDPDALAAALKHERAALANEHPSMGDKITDESIEMSRRSAMFLKRAGSRLTPAAVQVAISRFGTQLFALDLDMGGFDQLCDRIIQLMEPDQAALEEYFRMPASLQARMATELQRAGWEVGGSGVVQNILLNPAAALKLWKSGTAGSPRPPMAPPLNTLVALDDNSEAERVRMLQAFPNTPLNPGNERSLRLALTQWEEYQALGGTPDRLRDALVQLGGRGDYMREACSDVGLALRVLKMGNALQAADLDNLEIDETLADIGHYRDLLAETLPALASGPRGQTQQMLDTMQQQLDLDPPPSAQAKASMLNTLRRLSGPLLESAKARLTQKVRTLISIEVEEHRKQAYGLWLDSIESYDIAGIYRNLSGVNRALAEAD